MPTIKDADRDIQIFYDKINIVPVLTEEELCILRGIYIIGAQREAKKVRPWWVLWAFFVVGYILGSMSVL